jgi:hypothetical protein
MSILKKEISGGSSINNFTILQKLGKSLLDDQPSSSFSQPFATFEDCGPSQ